MTLMNKKPEKTEEKKKERIVVVTGKRKVAVARASVRKGRGVVRINSKKLASVRPDVLRLKIEEPLLLASDAASGVDISITTRGGGVTGQADAARQAIARGLVEWSRSGELKKRFLKYDRNLLVYDPRRNEPSKLLRSAKGSRRKRQSSKR